MTNTNDYKQAIKELIEKVKNTKEDYDSEADEFVYAMQIEETFEKFGEDITSECDICNLADKFPELKKDVLDLFNVIITRFKRRAFYENDEVHAGQIIAYHFAINHSDDLDLYITFIGNCDIDHAVDEWKEILALYNKYGLTDKIWDLLLLYIFRSQHGDEMFSELMADEKVNNYVSEETDKFLKRIVQFLDSDYGKPVRNKDLITIGMENIFMEMDEDDAESMAEKFLSLYDEDAEITIEQLREE